MKRLRSESSPGPVRVSEMARSLDPLFRPESVAVVGASRSPGTIGYQLVGNLLRHG